jgi:hypothetical protein
MRQALNTKQRFNRNRGGLVQVVSALGERMTLHLTTVVQHDTDSTVTPKRKGRPRERRRRG